MTEKQKAYYEKNKNNEKLKVKFIWRKIKIR